MTRHRMISQAIAVCLVTLTAALAVAQEAADRAKPCIPAKRPGDVRSLSLDVFATLVPTGDSARPSAMYLATLLQEIQGLLRAPDTIAGLSGGGEMSMWLHPDGRLTNPVAADAILAPEIVRALSAAIDSTSRRGGIGPVFPAVGADSVPVRLVVHYASKPTPLSVPLFRVSLPPPYLEFEVDRPAVAKRGNPFPKYPEDMRQMGFEGEVLTQFVVNQAGRAEMRTFRVLKPAHEEFVRAVRDVLPRMRFSPAELGGCAVRQLVQLPFAFKLNW